MSVNDRIYMVARDDEKGDHHLFATDNLARALAARREMKERLLNVRGNWALEDVASD